MSWKSWYFPLQYWDFLHLKSNFPHLKFNFPCTKSDLPKSAFYFLQRLSAFFNGFPLSSMAFLTFFKVFPLSPMAFQISPTAFWFSFTAFRFPRNPRKSIYGEKSMKDHYLSFVFFATRSPSFVIPAKQYLRLTQQFLVVAGNSVVAGDSSQNKTDKSKRRIVGFLAGAKTPTGQTAPWLKGHFEKKQFQCFSYLISIDRCIVRLISINMNIIWHWRQLISIKSNIILISINCYSIVGLISIKSNIIRRWQRLISIKNNIIQVTEYQLEWWGLGVVGLVNLFWIIIINLEEPWVTQPNQD